MLNGVLVLGAIGIIWILCYWKDSTKVAYRRRYERDPKSWHNTQRRKYNL